MTATTKLLKTYSAEFLAAITVAGIVSVAGFCCDPKGFGINILAGVAVMGFSIPIGVLLVDRVAKRAETAERDTRLLSLHDSLSRVLTFLLGATEGNVFYWSKHAPYAETLVTESAKLQDIKARLDAGTYELSLMHEKSVIDSAHEVLATFRSLTPLAFELGEAGMIWVSIGQSLDRLVELYPFDAAGRRPKRIITIGEDSFCLSFVEMIEDMLKFNDQRQTRNLTTSRR